MEYRPSGSTLAAVPVLPGDDEAKLATRVLRAEHQLYPMALRLIAAGQVRVEGERAIVSGAPAGEAALFSPPLLSPALP